jgi:hypothetical protein
VITRINITLDENDYLQFQLYTASKSKRVKNQRRREWIFTTVTFLALAYLFKRSENDTLSIFFLATGCLTAILHPFYSRWRYKRHYRRAIRNTYQHSYGKPFTLEINNNEIITTDNGSTGKINLTEIDEIHEITDQIFIQTKGGASLMISKSKSENFETLKAAIASAVEQHGIKYHTELNWKWR